MHAHAQLTAQRTTQAMTVLRETAVPACLPAPSLAQHRTPCPGLLPTRSLLPPWSRRRSQRALHHLRDDVMRGDAAIAHQTTCAPSPQRSRHLRRPAVLKTLPLHSQTPTRRRHGPG